MSDGIDHINVYSKGATELGRALSNFSAHVVQTVDGTFSSIEGYWYWLGCREDELRRDELRLLIGWEAKKVGRELRATDWGHTASFKLKIVNAMTAKLIGHPEISTMLYQSVLPFRHYYLYQGKVVEPSGGEWVVETWEFLRRLIKANR